MNLKVYSIALPIEIKFSLLSVAGLSSLEQPASKFSRVIGGIPDRGLEHSCFMSPPRVVRIQAIIPHFSNIGDGFGTVRQLHDGN